MDPTNASVSPIANDHKSLCLSLAEQLIQRGFLSLAQQVVRRITYSVIKYFQCITQNNELLINIWYNGCIL